MESPVDILVVMTSAFLSGGALRKTAVLYGDGS